MMVDEIQTGFGRTGALVRLRARRRRRPTSCTLAKAIGNGMPVGACWAREDVAAVFEPGDHGSTYSGTAIATAAVNAVIAEMRRIDAPALAAQAGRARSAPALARSRGQRRSAVGGCCSPPSSTSATRRRSIATLLDHGLVANAVDADRAAVRPAAHRSRRRDRRGRRDA